MGTNHNLTGLILVSSIAILSITIIIGLLIAIWNSHPQPESYVITKISDTVDDPLVECPDDQKITTLKKVNESNIIKYECGVSGRVGQLVTFYEE